MDGSRTLSPGSMSSSISLPVRVRTLFRPQFVSYLESVSTGLQNRGFSIYSSGKGRNVTTIAGWKLAITFGGVRRGVEEGERKY